MFGDLNGSLGKEREKMNKEDVINMINKEHKEKLYVARATYKVLDKVNGFELNLKDCYVYPYCIFFDFEADDLLLFEDRLDELTEALENVRWEKTVTQNYVKYEASYTIRKKFSIAVYITIEVKPGPYCSIVQVSNGKVKQIENQIEEVLEYEIDYGKNLKEEDEEESVRTFEDLFESEMNKESTNPFTSL